MIFKRIQNRVFRAFKQVPQKTILLLALYVALAMCVYGLSRGSWILALISLVLLIYVNCLGKNIFPQDYEGIHRRTKRSLFKR